MGISWAKPLAGRGQRRGLAASDKGGPAPGGGFQGQVSSRLEGLAGRAVQPWRNHGAGQAGNTGTHRRNKMDLGSRIQALAWSPGAEPLLQWDPAVKSEQNEE